MIKRVVYHSLKVTSPYYLFNIIYIMRS